MRQFPDSNLVSLSEPDTHDCTDDCIFQGHNTLQQLGLRIVPNVPIVILFWQLQDLNPQPSGYGHRPLI